MKKTVLIALAGCLAASCGPRTEYASTPAGQGGPADGDPSAATEGYERITCFEGGRKIVDDYAKGYSRGGSGGFITYDSVTTNGTVSIGGSCIMVTVRDVGRDGWTPVVPGFTDRGGT